MPFDTLPQTQQLFAEQIGLVPVPREVLEAHKVHVEIQFRRQYPQNSEARWMEYTNRAAVMRNFTGITHMMAYYTGHHRSAVRHQDGKISCVGGQPPAAVQAVVAEAERRAQQAGLESERVGGFFWTDPYLCLHHNGVNHCLAIWDGDTVLHIAKFYR
jgi:hypothetical protein